MLLQTIFITAIGIIALLVIIIDAIYMRMNDRAKKADKVNSRKPS